IVRSISVPLGHTVNAMASIASGEGDLTRALDTNGNDELTALAKNFNAFTSKLREVISQSLASASQLNSAARSLGGVAGEAQQHSEQQSLQMDQVATAINQVTYGVQDVA
ncbi:MAG TPA: methyl-accepting chemotaxis protein, partial [Pseudomonas sp.]|nr:methyl-accepting chemotaxis protein [Pseudomonas sp.]